MAIFEFLKQIGDVFASAGKSLAGVVGGTVKGSITVTTKELGKQAFSTSISQATKSISKKGTMNTVENKLFDVASSTGGILFSSASIVIGFLISVVTLICYYGFFKSCKRGGVSLSEWIADASSELLKDMKQYAPTPVFIVIVFFFSLVENLVTKIVLPILRNIIPLTIMLGVIIITVYMFELNKAAFVQSVDYSARAGVMVANVGLSIFDLMVQGSNFLSPLVNSEIHSGVTTTLAFYDAIVKQQAFPVSISEVQQDFNLFSASGNTGRRQLRQKQGEIPQYKILEKVKKAMKAKVIFDQSKTKLGIVIIALVFGSGLGSVFFAAFVVMQAVIFKAGCFIADVRCGIQELIEWIFNGIIYLVNLILSPIPIFKPFGYIESIACGEKDFVSGMVKECAGGVTTILNPGLFRGLLTSSNARRLMNKVIHCELFEGKYTEYYRTIELHSTSNSSLACPRTYEALSNGMRAILLLEELDNSESCIDFCITGTAVEFCPIENTTLIVGKCKTPQRRQLLPNRFNKFMKLNSTTLAHGHSKFQLLHDLKNHIPSQFTVNNFDCNLRLDNANDIYEIFVGLYCLVSYIFSTPDLKSLLMQSTTTNFHSRQLSVLNGHFNVHEIRKAWYIHTNGISPLVHLGHTEETSNITNNKPRRLQNKISPWMMPCPSNIDPSQILCPTDMITCTDDFFKCPPINLDNPPNELELVLFQYTQLMTIYESFEPSEYVSDVITCWRTTTNENSPISPQNLDKPIEEQVLLTHCTPMIKPSLWKPSYYTLSATGYVNDNFCVSPTQFNGCNCPGCANIDVFRVLFQDGPFSPALLLLVHNGLMTLWMVITTISPVAIIIYPFIPISSRQKWDVVNSDLTGYEKAWCFVWHIPSLLSLVFIFWTARLMANWVIGTIESTNKRMDVSSNEFNKLDAENETIEILNHLNDRMLNIEQSLKRKE